MSNLNEEYSKKKKRTDAPAGGVQEAARVAWPIVIAMLSYTAMDVADTLFVGWVGKTELAAVGLATMAMLMAIVLFVGRVGPAKLPGWPLVKRLVSLGFPMGCALGWASGRSPPSPPCWRAWARTSSPPIRSPSR